MCAFADFPGGKLSFKDHDGEDILRLAKHKVHVCWYGGDKALLARRADVWSNRGKGDPQNLGRPALGRNGLGKEYTPKPIADVVDSEGKIKFPKFKGDSEADEGNVVPLLVHKLAATDGKLWNDTKTGLLGIYKASGHMYQTEDKALDSSLDQMKANCDTP